MIWGKFQNRYSQRRIAYNRLAVMAFSVCDGLCGFIFLGVLCAKQRDRARQGPCWGQMSAGIKFYNRNIKTERNDMVVNWFDEREIVLWTKSV